MTIQLPQAHKPPPEAGCGTCTACCVIPAVQELGKPFYAKCVHVGAGCTIYDDRPHRCREYRCAWHLGMLGERVDRRPDQCGVMFQFNPAATGQWYLGIFELTEGAARTEKARFLRDVILKNKQVRHLHFGNPPVQIYPFGSDIPVDFPIDQRFDYQPALGEAPWKSEVGASVFAGKTREILEPRREE